MPAMPRDPAPESTLAFLRDPYRFISARCRRYQADLFETRLLLQKTICMTGKEAAELFYDPERFTRLGAAPEPVKSTLFGHGGVQGLDGQAHLHRKQTFMGLMTPARVDALADTTADWWRVYARKWAMLRQVVLYDELHEILCQAVCAWAGVPLAGAEVRQRTQELTALFDQAGAGLLPHLWSRLARKRADRWMARLIKDIRAGRHKPPEGSAAHVIAWHRDIQGTLLDTHTAAVELLNVLRPTVAVSVFITFAALALHQYPEYRPQVAADEDGFAELFVQEVRRFYPFFPAVTARVRHDFTWHGYHFPRGRLVLLDLYGTNHDPRLWEEPEAFRPERFRHWDGSPFNFIPQGGGDHYVNHRCPGEWITIALMQLVLSFLARDLTYDVPAQDLRIDYTRLPALPRSRFIISNVKGDI